MTHQDPTSWRIARRIYYVLLFVIFGVIAFYLGPNWFLFHKLTRSSPSDFTAMVEQRCIPTLQALAQYRADYGKFPISAVDLAPKYLPRESVCYGRLNGNEFRLYTNYHQVISFDTEHPERGWSIHGRFTNGPIPVSPRELHLATQPATHPAQ
jgi:hypothetical protein